MKSPISIGRSVALCLVSQFLVLATAQAEDLKRVAGVDIPISNCTTSEPLVCDLKKNSNAQLDGEQKCFLQFHKDVLVYQAEYRSGALNGKLRCWTGGRDRKPGMEGEFKKGKQDGLTKLSWDEKLKKFTTEIDFKDGLKDGFQISKSVLYSGDKATITGEMIRMYKEGKENGFSFVVEGGKIVNFGDCMLMGERSKKEDACKAISLGKYQSLLDSKFEGDEQKATDRCNGLKKTDFGGGFAASGSRYVEQSQKVNCLREGPATLFAGDGKTKLAVTLYEKDKRQGEQKVFFKEGQVSQTITYKDDKAQHIEQFFQNGKKKSEIDLKYSKPGSVEYSVKTFFDNGSPQEISKTEGYDDDFQGSLPTVSDFFAGGNFTGCRTLYNREQSVPLSECYNGEHKLDGLTSYQKGDEFVEVTYDNGTMVVQKTSDAKTKKLLKTVSYFPDGSVKEEVSAK